MQLYFVPFGKKGELWRRGAASPAHGRPEVRTRTRRRSVLPTGFEAARGGKQLISVQSHTGKLFTIDPATGVTKEIVLDKAVTNGDGLLRRAASSTSCATRTTWSRS